jgi:ornithine cyclodeaminase/alanine dehydrogenase-like protein (mu-crystallin family)
MYQAALSIVFDSTGMARQGVAAPAVTYRRALEHGQSVRSSFNA